MPKEQQIAFMKTRIVPGDGPAVQGARRDEGTATSAARRATDRNTRTRTSSCRIITLKDGKITAFTEKPEVAKFMAETVSPKMADAMGLPHFDMKTMQGFGCGGCHTIDKK